jgi:hypothetical protein
MFIAHLLSRKSRVEEDLVDQRSDRRVFAGQGLAGRDERGAVAPPRGQT